MVIGEVERGEADVIIRGRADDTAGHVLTCSSQERRQVARGGRPRSYSVLAEFQRAFGCSVHLKPLLCYTDRTAGPYISKMTTHLEKNRLNSGPLRTQIDECTHFARVLAVFLVNWLSVIGKSAGIKSAQQSAAFLGCYNSNL